MAKTKPAVFPLLTCLALEEATSRTGDYTIEKLPAVIGGGRYKVLHNAKVFNHVEFNLAFNNVIYNMRVERRSDFQSAQ